MPKTRSGPECAPCWPRSRRRPRSVGGWRTTVVTTSTRGCTGRRSPAACAPPRWPRPKRRGGGTPAAARPPPSAPSWRPCRPGEVGEVEGGHLSSVSTRTRTPAGRWRRCAGALGLGRGQEPGPRPPARRGSPAVGGVAGCRSRFTASAFQGAWGQRFRSKRTPVRPQEPRGAPMCPRWYQGDRRNQPRVHFPRSLLLRAGLRRRERPRDGPQSRARAVAPAQDRGGP